MTASAYVTSVWRLALILNDCLTKVLRPVMRRYGITQSQAQLLFSVHRDSEATVGIIAEKLGLPVPMFPPCAKNWHTWAF